MNSHGNSLSFCVLMVLARALARKQTTRFWYHFAWNRSWEVLGGWGLVTRVLGPPIKVAFWKGQNGTPAISREIYSRKNYFNLPKNLC